MRRLMLGKRNPNMAAATFCSALLSSPRTKCRQNMEMRMENSTSHDTFELMVAVQIKDNSAI